MYPQTFQGQAFTPQGAWGSTQFAPQGVNLNDVVNVISRILPLLQLQGSPFTPQTGAFGFPQQAGLQGPFTNPFGHSGVQLPFQANPFAGQGGGPGYSQFASQPTNLVDIVNVLTRVLPLLQQTTPFGGQGNVSGFPQQQMTPFGGQGNVFGYPQQQTTPFGGQGNVSGYPQQQTTPFGGQGNVSGYPQQQTTPFGGQGNVFGFPQQQQFGTQGITPEVASVISRILPYLATFQTAGPVYGSTGNPYIH